MGFRVPSGLQVVDLSDHSLTFGMSVCCLGFVALNVHVLVLLPFPKKCQVLLCTWGAAGVPGSADQLGSEEV